MPQNMQKKIPLPSLLLFLTWLTVQAYLLLSAGINLHGESARIIREAGFLAHGAHFSSPIYFSYLTEIALVYFKIKLGIGYGFIVGIQLLLNLLALLIFHSFCIKLYQSGKLALAASLLLLACYPYQAYNGYLYTESIFFSLSIIYSCSLVGNSRITPKHILKLAFLLLLMCLTRPTGLFFVIATFIYLYFARLHKTGPISFLISLAMGLSAIITINFAMGTGGGIDIIRPLREGHIICDVPTFSVDGQSITNPGSNSIFGLISYVFDHPKPFLSLAIKKSSAFFGLTRHYYSGSHNLFLALFFYPLYALILLTLIRFGKKTPAAFLYFLCVMALFWLCVVFSCDEWHNRFFLTLVPFIITMGLYFFTKKRY
jgi:hypothetical protein